jgi:hypothetical protein
MPVKDERRKEKTGVDFWCFGLFALPLQADTSITSTINTQKYEDNKPFRTELGAKPVYGRDS